MTTSLRDSWWVILTAILGVIPLGLSLAMATTVSGGGAYRWVGVAVATVSGALLIAGLVRRQSDPISGSQMIVAGAALTLVGGLEFIPVGIIVLLSGFWTGNLQLSATSDAPDLRPARQHQINMTRYWFVWLAGAAVLFAIGWIPLIAEGDDLTWGYFIWVLSWLGAIITGGIGVILGGLRLTVRHHTRRTDVPASQAT